MRRTLVIIISLLAVVAIIGAAYIYISRPSSTTPAQQQTSQTVVTLPINSTTVQPSAQSVQIVQAAFKNQLPPSNPDNTKLRNTAIVQNYALQLWTGDNMGGEALLKYDTAQAKWIVMTAGGGAWTVPDLVAEGVPQDVASALLATMPQ